MIKKIDLDFHGRPLSVEVGRLAKQADGAALVTYGETVVLVTAVAAKDLKLETDFFPLTVDYQEKTFAAGKIPGGFFKREGRPSEKEILTCRLIDRSIRPLFTDGLRCETQVIATVLSADRENDPDVVAMLGTSIALHVSDIPFNGPLAGVRLGRIDGQLIINPTQSQLMGSDMDIFLSGSRDAIVMVEGGAQMVPEDEILEALYAGHEAIGPLLQLQEDLRREVGKAKRHVPLAQLDSAIIRRVEELACPSCSRRSKYRKNWSATNELPKLRTTSFRRFSRNSRIGQRTSKGPLKNLKESAFAAWWFTSNDASMVVV